MSRFEKSPRTGGVPAAIAVLLATLVVATPALAATEEDRFEAVNRKIFWFNDKLDVYLLEPAAKGWDFLLPDRVQRSVDDFFDNLRFPVVFLNTLLQGKPEAAGRALGRFAINTCLGAGGFLDPASAAGLEHVNEDFGQTLGWWGLGGGPYLVLPLLGPSSIRDGFGLLVDSPARVWPFFVPTEVTWSVTAVQAVNTRSLFLEQVRIAKRDSLDYYASVRDAYLQYREGLVADIRTSGGESDEEQDDLYYPDDDLYYPDVE